MNRRLFVVLTSVLVALAGFLQAQTATELEVLKLDRGFDDASMKKDRPTLERLIADDYVYVHSNGTVANKAEELASLMSADVKWTASKLDDMKVRIFGDVALVTAVQTLTGSAKGFVSGARRYTDVWVRRSGRWQIVGGQATLVPAK